MEKHPFEFGPLAQGTYRALLWCTLVIGWTSPEYLPYHIALLLFLGLGLKPLVERFRLHIQISNFLDRIEARRWKEHTEKRRRDTERRERKKYKKFIGDPDKKLPKHW